MGVEMKRCQMEVSAFDQTSCISFEKLNYQKTKGILVLSHSHPLCRMQNANAVNARVMHTRAQC